MREREHRGLRSIAFASAAIALVMGCRMRERPRQEGAPPAAGAQVTTAAWRGYRAGVARLDITPWNNGYTGTGDASGAPAMWLAGYSGKYVATGVTAPLYVRVLALDDGTSTKVIVSADVLGFTGAIRGRIAAAASATYGISPEDLMLAATHTHHGPVLEDNLDPPVTYALTPAELAIVSGYTRWLEGRIVEAIGVAVSGMAPATLGYGVGQVAPGRLGYNRSSLRYATVQHRTLLGPRTSPIVGGVSVGSIDPDVHVLAVMSAATNELLSVVYTVACHPVTAQAPDRYDPDYPGVVADQLEQDGAVALLLQGAAGDIRPLSTDLDGVPVTTSRAGSVVADAVRGVLGSGLTRISAPIASTYADVSLPLDLEQLDAAGKVIDMARLAALYGAIAATEPDTYAAAHARQIVERAASGTFPRTESLPIQVWRIGPSGSSPVVLAAFGGELVSGYALYFKSLFAAQLGNRLWIASYANEVPGYIPTQQTLDLPALGPLPGLGAYDAGWGDAIRVDSTPAGDVDVTSAIATGSQLFYGWPARLRGGPGGVEDTLVLIASKLIGGAIAGK